MNTKIIFLDIDGVLNSHLYYASGRADTNAALGRRKNIDDQSVAFLNDLIQCTGAKVVLTSSWRTSRTVDEIQAQFESAGFVGEVIDKTKDLKSGDDGHCVLRGNEILCWMKDNPSVLGCRYSDYRHYVIFDDDSDMLYWQRNNYIHVDPYCGLTPNNIFHAKRILNA